jgi:hypothetical protein
VDHDGSVNYSTVVLIKGVKPEVTLLAGVYPNPAKDVLNALVVAVADQQIDLVVTDLNGKVVLRKVIGVVTGDNLVSINVGGLAAGSYVLKANCNSDCEGLVTRFVKQ